MADGDIVHGQPYGFYRKAYEAICEGRNDSSYTLMDGLMKHIKHIGNVPVIFAKDIDKYLAEAIENGNVSWNNLSQGLDHIKNQYLEKAPHYHLEIALRAGKRVLNEFRYGERGETNNLEEKIVGQYMKELFQSGFEDRIDPTVDHHNDIDPAILIDHVQNIRPEMDHVIDTKWAKKAAENEDVSKLQRPKRKKVQPIDMDEDLLG